MPYASHLVHSHRPTIKVGDHTALHIIIITIYIIMIFDTNEPK